jgi:1-acyl-sn-glycerol-3-phosphate acyltransferase
MSVYTTTRAVLRPLSAALFAAHAVGAENVPASGPLVVAANHRSYLDPPLLGTWFPRVLHYMAKRELFANPLIGAILRSVHAFPVDRDRADLGAIKHALETLKRGECVGIFPEGRRNLDGAAKARGGAILIAATARCPIVPVGLVGTNLAVRRWRGARVEVRIGAPLIFQGTERKPTKVEIERWTEELSASIERLLADR